MLKDIPQLVVDKIIVAVVRETNEDDFLVWNVYLVNMYDSEIRGVMVSSKGYGQYEGRDVKTTILRHVIGNIRCSVRVSCPSTVQSSHNREDRYFQ